MEHSPLPPIIQSFPKLIPERIRSLHETLYDRPEFFGLRHYNDAYEAELDKLTDRSIEILADFLSDNGEFYSDFPNRHAVALSDFAFRHDGLAAFTAPADRYRAWLSVIGWQGTKYNLQDNLTNSVILLITLDRIQSMLETSKKRSEVIQFIRTIEEGSVYADVSAGLGDLIVELFAEFWFAARAIQEAHETAVLAVADARASA
jgi:hypothetical protein